MGGTLFLRDLLLLTSNFRYLLYLQVVANSFPHFRTYKKPNSFVFRRFRTLDEKDPGWGRQFFRRFPGWGANRGSGQATKDPCWSDWNRLTTLGHERV